jgi:hypothetical protein
MCELIYLWNKSHDFIIAMGKRADSEYPLRSKLAPPLGSKLSQSARPTAPKISLLKRLARTWVPNNLRDKIFGYLVDLNKVSQLVPRSHFEIAARGGSLAQGRPKIIWMLTFSIDIEGPQEREC